MYSGGLPETVEHVLLKCAGYNEERSQLIEVVKTVGIKRLTLKNLLNNNSKVTSALLEYLKKTCLISSI